ncbi:MAG: nucleotidyltransferase family protein [Elainellaceae cyanobacterium]
MTTSHLPTLLQSRLATTPEQVKAFCQRWCISEFALFGSVLRPDFQPESDVDVLVSFNESGDNRWSIFDLIRMQQELESLFQREVDLVEKAGLQNPYRRAEILDTCRVIFSDKW